MVKSRLMAVFLAALVSASCVSVPTPSGRPELKVRLPVSEVKARIVNQWSTAGWFVQGSDDIGFNLSKSLNSGEAALVGSGSKLIRVNLTEGSDGVTQIRVTCLVQSAGMATDTSADRMGLDIQRALERMFASDAVDGPYVQS